MQIPLHGTILYLARPRLSHRTLLRLALPKGAGLLSNLHHPKSLVLDVTLLGPNRLHLDHTLQIEALMILVPLHHFFAQFSSTAAARGINSKDQDLLFPRFP